MRNNKEKVITIAALVMAVIGLSIGFAAFSSTLSISTRASVNPTGSMSVIFASRATTDGGTLTYQDNTSNYPIATSELNGGKS